MTLDSSKIRRQVKKVGNEFVVFSPDIGIIESSESLPEAYTMFEEGVSTFLETVEKFNLEAKQSVASSAVTTPKKFYKRALIVVAAACVVVLTVNVSAKAIRKSLDRAVDKAVTKILYPGAKKKAERVERFRKVLSDASPYIKEIKKVLKEQ